MVSLACVNCLLFKTCIPFRAICHSTALEGGSWLHACLVPTGSSSVRPEPEPEHSLCLFPRCNIQNSQLQPALVTRGRPTEVVSLPSLAGSSGARRESRHSLLALKQGTHAPRSAAKQSNIILNQHFGFSARRWTQEKLLLATTMLPPWLKGKATALIPCSHRSLECVILSQAAINETSGLFCVPKGFCCPFLSSSLPLITGRTTLQLRGDLVQLLPNADKFSLVQGSLFKSILCEKNEYRWACLHVILETLRYFNSEVCIWWSSLISCITHT